MRTSKRLSPKLKKIKKERGETPRSDILYGVYSMPWSSIADATFSNPAMFAPAT